MQNVAAAGVAPAAGAANADTTAHYSGEHIDIERIESSMKKFLSENCVDTNATVMQNIRTFLDHVSNVFKDQVVLYEMGKLGNPGWQADGGNIRVGRFETFQYQLFRVD